MSQNRSLQQQLRDEINDFFPELSKGTRLFLAHERRGDELRKKEDYRAAIACYNDAIQALSYIGGPAYLIAKGIWYKKALAMIKDQAFFEAKKCFEYIINEFEIYKDNELNGNLFKGLGDVNYELDDKVAALNSYREAERIYPANAIPSALQKKLNELKVYDLAWVSQQIHQYLSENHVQKAMALFREAFTTHPELKSEKEEIEDLLQNNIEIDFTQMLFNSAIYGVKASAKLTLLQGEASNSKRGESAIHLAVKRGDVESLKILLEQNKDDLEKLNQDKQTPLHYAIYYNHTECLAVLLAHRANVNATDIVGNTPLHQAVLSCAFSNVKMEQAKAYITLLLEKGGNVNALNHANKTAYSLSQEGGGVCDELTRYLGKFIHKAPCAKARNELAKLRACVNSQIIKYQVDIINRSSFFYNKKLDAEKDLQAENLLKDIKTLENPQEIYSLFNRYRKKDKALAISYNKTPSTFTELVDRLEEQVNRIVPRK